MWSSPCRAACASSLTGAAMAVPSRLVVPGCRQTQPCSGRHARVGRRASRQPRGVLRTERADWSFATSPSKSSMARFAPAQSLRTTVVWSCVAAVPALPAATYPAAARARRALASRSLKSPAARSSRMSLNKAGHAALTKPAISWRNSTSPPTLANAELESKTSEFCSIAVNLSCAPEGMRPRISQPPARLQSGRRAKPAIDDVRVFFQTCYDQVRIIRN